MAQEKMIIGGGCFWCIEAAFNQVKGVNNAISGYCGGSEPHANYDDVCTGTTGHAEVVCVTFDNKQIDYSQLLHLFLTLHDATQLNKQGNDIGPQYRSIIFYQDDNQKAVATKIINECNQQGLFSQQLVTKIEPSQPFYAAEDYHQGYYLKNPNQGYCMAVIAPKFQKFKAQYDRLLK